MLGVSTAVIRDDERVYVYDPASGTIEERVVETGISNWEFTEILSGLNAGEQVVTTIDREGLEPGAAVEPE